jgi:hypothetical protein
MNPSDSNPRNLRTALAFAAIAAGLFAATILGYLS